MKTRLFIALLALATSPAAVSQTVQDALEYLASQCLYHRIQIGGDGVATLTDDDDVASVTVNLKDVAEVTIDLNGDTALHCRQLNNPFATAGERHYCMQGPEQKGSNWHVRGCHRYQGVAKALLFLIQQRNPDVELNFLND